MAVPVLEIHLMDIVTACTKDDTADLAQIEAMVHIPQGVV